VKILFIYPDYKVEIDPDTHSRSHRKGRLVHGGCRLHDGAAAPERPRGGALPLTEPAPDAEFVATVQRRGPDLIGFVTMTREYRP